jgi:integrase
VSTVFNHGTLLLSGSGVILPGAENRAGHEKGESLVARPRWQQGWLFQRGKRNPVWVGRFREDVLTADGIRRRRVRSVVLGRVSEIGKRQAQRLLSERLAAINQGTHKPEVVITFERFVLERWEPNILPTLRPGTQRNYRSVIRHDLMPFFGAMKLSEIGRADVQMFLADKSKRVAPRTVLTLRNRLSKIFAIAVQWGYLQMNPAQGTQVPALEDTRERLALRPEQVRELLGALPEPYRTMILLAVLSGLRRGELFGLRWKWVDFEKGAVTVAEAIYLGHSAAPKTKASRRKVFVDAAVLEALAKLRPANVHPDAFVFATERGTPLSPANVMNRVLQPACDHLKLPRVSWHSFRYTYTTWADASGESIKAIQAQLGHTDSKLTLSVYTQPMPEAQRHVAGKVARVLLPDAPKSQPVVTQGSELIQ